MINMYFDHFVPCYQILLYCTNSIYSYGLIFSLLSFMSEKALNLKKQLYDSMLPIVMILT